MLPIPSTNSTANEATTPERPKTSPKGPLIDEDGFITPHPIKEKSPVADKDSKQPEFRGKFPPNAQAETSSTPAKNGSANNKRTRQRQGPRGEIQIGSLHSKVKSSDLLTTQPTAAASSKPKQQQQQGQQPAGKGDSTNTVNSATKPNPHPTQTPDQGRKQVQTQLPKAQALNHNQQQRPKDQTRHRLRRKLQHLLGRRSHRG
jgi:hypothetical protein